MILSAYLVLTPLLVIRVPSTPAFGAADILLFPAIVGLLTLDLRRTRFDSLCLLAFGTTFTLQAAIRLMSGTIELGDALREVRPLAIVVPYVVGSQLRLSDSSQRRALRQAVHAGAIAMLIALGIYILKRDVGGAQQTLFVGDGQGLRARASGLIGNTGGFGHLLGGWMYICAAAIADPARQRRLHQLGTYLALGAILLLLSGSRGALVYPLCGLAVYALMRRRFLQSRQIRSVVILLLSAIGALTIFYKYVDPALAQTALTRLDILNISGHGTFYQTRRTSTFSSSLEQAIGTRAWGIGASELGEGTGHFIDNAYLSSFIAGGVAGGSLFLISTAAIIRHIIRVGRTGHLGALWAGLACGHFIYGTYIDTFTLWTSTPWILALLGACRPRLGR